MAWADESDRSQEIAPALHGEILRAGVLRRLEERWSVPVTTVVAGAGFGKSTAIAQARRLQSLAPDGLEVHHRCTAGDEDARQLAPAIVTLVDPGRPPASEPADSVLEALRARTPVPVCVILDDVHELPDGSSGARLIADLVAGLPNHAHLVLVGRRLPRVRLAHLQASDRVVHIDAGALSFSPEEMREIAEQAGRPFESVEALGGWPALVRLTLTAPVGAPRRYLWDEVISGLDPDLRRVIPYLALAGELDGDGIEQMIGEPVDVERLATLVPLVELSDGGNVMCHQLWRDVVDRTWERRDVDQARRAVVDLMLARHAVVRAGSVAVGGRDRELIRRPAVTLVGSTIGAFPADTGERWLRGLGVDGPDAEPAVELLRIATLQARTPHDPEIATALDELLALEGQPASVMIPALAIGGIAAHAITDVSWLKQLVERARQLADEQDEPIARLVLAGISAATAELDGDIARGLADIEDLGLGHALGDTVARFYLHLLILAGRADEAVPVADSIASGQPRIGASRFPSFARWCAGDPSGVLGAPTDLAPESGTNDRFRFANLVHRVPIFGSLGHRDAAVAAVAELRLAGYRSPKDRAQLLVAEAVADIVCGDESSAAARYAEHLAEFPSSEMVSTVHLRRYAAIGYPLSSDDAELWDVEAMGPTLRSQLEPARLLVDLRCGRASSDPLPETARLLTALPLPWSVEVVALAFAHDRDGAVGRFADLVASTDGAAHDELRSLLDAGTAPSEAAELLELVARPSTRVLRIEMIDGFRVLIDGEPVEATELRRRRVRQVIGLLVVEGAMTRDRLMQFVWPDRSRPAAARNLRVTLSYVRKVLDVGDASSHLGDDGDTLSLAPDATLETDVWDLRTLSSSLAAARERGDPLAIEDALRQIVAFDARDPLPDLVDLDEAGPQVEWCRAEVLDAVLALGERRLTQGRATEALAHAHSARAASPWSERAGRLAIAAQLLCGDAELAAVEAARMQAMLDELGVAPDDRTRLLLTRARST